MAQYRSLSARRAWIEIQISKSSISRYVSLSARRAWIEISPSSLTSTAAAVALRKESVDRNAVEPSGDKAQAMSLSARRAWIEIGSQSRRPRNRAVALRKESVDRNALLYWLWVR